MDVRVGESDCDRTSSDGNSGLEVLMMIIEKSLSPSIDESQRILAGPLIADLVQKVPFPQPLDKD
jgi:hypothetical protein